MNNEFAKLFQVGDHQVLFVKRGLSDEPPVDGPEDDDAYDIQVSCKFEFALIDMTLGGFTEEKYDLVFAAFDQASAERAFVELSKTYKEIFE